VSDLEHGWKLFFFLFGPGVCGDICPFHTKHPETMRNRKQAQKGDVADECGCTHSSRAAGGYTILSNIQSDSTSLQSVPGGCQRRVIPLLCRRQLRWVG
jgi:hypothetical protein